LREQKGVGLFCILPVAERSGARGRGEWELSDKAGCLTELSTALAVSCFE